MPTALPLIVQGHFRFIGYCIEAVCVIVRNIRTRTESASENDGVGIIITKNNIGGLCQVTDNTLYSCMPKQ